MIADESQTLFFNGEPISQSDSIPLDNRAFQHGDGFFTSFLLKKGKVSALDLHLKRLQDSIKICSLDANESIFEQKIIIILKHISQTFQNEICRIKIMCWRQDGIAYNINANGSYDCLIIVKPFISINPSNPIHLVQVNTPRISSNMMSSKVKWINGISSIKAQLEAKDLGGNLALQLSQNGHISEAANACIGWFSEDYEFNYPSDKTDALEGITIKHFCEFCESNGIQTNAVELKADAMQTAPAFILFNSISGAFKVDTFNKTEIKYRDRELDLIKRFNTWRWENADKI